MPITAVVISLKAEAALQQLALAALQQDPHMTLGEQQQRLLPAVIETETMSEGIDLVREGLLAIAGVEFVHVVSVDFSDMSGFAERLPPKRRRNEANQ